MIPSDRVSSVFVVGQSSPRSVREALLIMREALEDLGDHDEVWTRRDSDVAIVVMVRDISSGGSRRGIVDYNKALGGYSFRTFLWRGERTHSVEEIVDQVKRELLEV